MISDPNMGTCKNMDFDPNTSAWEETEPATTAKAETARTVVPNKYIGFKMISATPMTLGEFDDETLPPRAKKANIKAEGPEDAKREGYKVFYPDGYISWSPKDVFEKAYMEIDKQDKINHLNVLNFIKDYDVIQLGNKTIIVRATLANGFELVSSSNCVNPKNFDREVGINICKERIINRVWELLGFLLQTAQNGVK